MHLLFRLIYANGCRSTHHKLAMDALRHLESPDAKRWQALFLKHHAVYLRGAKEPDTKFKDFRNHVLHVSQDFWGGATKAARRWYDQAVVSLQAGRWEQAVFEAGVLSHYYTDPIQPFHTGQSEAENNVHRAGEWSICKSYDALRALAETQVGLPTVEVPRGRDWLEQMVIAGAEAAHPYYQPLIDHYDFDRGVKDPPTGLNEASRNFLAYLVGYAAVGFAGVLDRMFAEAGVAPPRAGLTVETLLSTLKIPIRWVTKKLADAKERKLVEAMYDELQKTGRVVDTLPEDDRAIRDYVAAEQRARAKSDGGAGADGGAGVPPAESSRDGCTTIATSRDGTTRPTRELRFYLDPASDVEDAPSIGSKTAKRLAGINVRSVADLMAADPEQAAAGLAVRWITAATIRDWQDQAALVCRVPRLRGHDAQILVACDYRDAAQVADARPDELLNAATRFASSAEGQRVIRSGKAPDADEVADWIAWAGQARPLRAA